MATSYRELDVWQTAMDLTAEGYRLCQHLPTAERFELSAQLRGALVSVPSNIAEGNASSYRGAYARHIGIALGSIGEVDTLVEIAVRVSLVQPPRTEALRELLVRVRQMLLAVLRRLRDGRAAPVRHRSPVH